MRVLYYGRHGETFDLAAGIRSRPDTALTDNGKAQMGRAGELLTPPWHSTLLAIYLTDRCLHL